MSFFKQVERMFAKPEPYEQEFPLHHHWPIDKEEDEQRRMGRESGMAAANDARSEDLTHYTTIEDVWRRGQRIVGADPHGTIYVRAFEAAFLFRWMERWAEFRQSPQDMSAPRPAVITPVIHLPPPTKTYKRIDASTPT